MNMKFKQMFLIYFKWFGSVLTERDLIKVQIPVNSSNSLFVNTFGMIINWLRLVQINIDPWRLALIHCALCGLSCSASELCIG